MGPIGDGRQSDDRVDAVIIGAGVAGGAAAIALALKLGEGRRVLLAERSAWPRHKVCGCCINAAGVAELRSLGVLDAVRGPRARLDRVELRAGTQVALVRTGEGLVVDRGELDAALVQRGRELGVEFLPACQAQVLGEPLSCGDRCVRLRSANGSTRLVRSRVVIAADGLAGSALAEIPELQPSVCARGRMGLGARLKSGDAGFEPTLDDGAIRMCVGPGMYVGMVRLPDGSLNIAAAGAPALIRTTGGPSAAIVRTLRTCGVEIGDQLGPVRGTPILTRHRRRVSDRGIIVVGDACGYVEPFTGEGMAWGLAGGRAAGMLAADAIAHPGVESMRRLEWEWSRWHASTILPRQRVCRWVRRLAHAWPAARAAVGVLGTGGVLAGAASCVGLAVGAALERPYPSAGRSREIA